MNEAQIYRGLPNQQPIILQPQPQHQTQNVGQSEDGDPLVPADLDQAATIGIPTEETQHMERNQNLSTNFSWQQQQQQQQFSIRHQNEYLQQAMKPLAAKMTPAQTKYYNTNPTPEIRALAQQLNISPAQVVIQQQATNMLRQIKKQQLQMQAQAFGGQPTSQPTPQNIPQIPGVPVPSPATVPVQNRAPRNNPTLLPLPQIHSLPSYPEEISERHQVAQRAAEAQNPEAQAQVLRHPDGSIHVTQQYGSQQAAVFFFANSDLSEPAFSLAQQNQLQYQWGIASTSQNDPIVHSHASPQPFPTALSGSSSSRFTTGDRTIQGQQHADPCVECQRRGLLCT